MGEIAYNKEEEENILEQNLVIEVLPPLFLPIQFQGQIKKSPRGSNLGPLHARQWSTP